MGALTVAFKVLSLLANLLPLVLHAEQVYREAGEGARKKALVVKALSDDAAAAVLAARDAGLLQDRHLEPKIEAVKGAVGTLVDASVVVLNTVGAFQRASVPPGGGQENA